jgi:hypothetical protein
MYRMFKDIMLESGICNCPSGLPVSVVTVVV